MGRYLGASIPTKLVIRKRKDSFSKIDIIKEQDKIYDKLNQYIDLTFYYVAYGEDEIYFKLNEEKANKYLKELLEEINSIMNLDNYLFYNLYREEDIEEQFKFDNTTIKVAKDDNDSVYYLTNDKDDKYLGEVYACFDGAPWLFDLEDDFSGIRATMKVVTLWINFEKFFSEDESKLLQLMNKFAKSYFKSKLSRVMIFHITE